MGRCRISEKSWDAKGVGKWGCGGVGFSTQVSMIFGLRNNPCNARIAPPK